MKVYKFKCDSCGSKKCVKIDGGYKCEYCGSVQDVIMPPEPVNVTTEDNVDAQEEYFDTRHELNHRQKSLLVRLILCLVAGYFGVHKFIEGKIFIGVVYAFTGGLFGVGIVIDTIRYIFGIIHANKNGGDTW